MSATIIQFKPRIQRAKPGGSNATDAEEKLKAAQTVADYRRNAIQYPTVSSFALLLVALISEIEVRGQQESMLAYHRAAGLMLEAAGVVLPAGPPHQNPA